MALPLWLCWLVACIVPDPAVAPQPGVAARDTQTVVRARVRPPVEPDSGEPDYSIGAAHPRAGRR